MLQTVTAKPERSMELPGAGDGGRWWRWPHRFKYAGWYLIFTSDGVTVSCAAAVGFVGEPWFVSRAAGSCGGISLRGLLFSLWSSAVILTKHENC